MCGFIAQLVEHHTGVAEVTGSNPVEALIFFFRLLYSNCLKLEIHCQDHISPCDNVVLYFPFTASSGILVTGNNSEVDIV